MSKDSFGKVVPLIDLKNSGYVRAVKCFPDVSNGRYPYYKPCIEHLLVPNTSFVIWLWLSCTYNVIYFSSSSSFFSNAILRGH